MVTITDKPDCGNAPRMQILRDLVVAIAERDHHHIESVLSDDFTWTLIGDHTMGSRDELRTWLTALPTVSEVEFGTLVTHGRGASVDGVFHLVDGSHSAFSHVLNFAGAAKAAKLASVKSYVINSPR